MPFGCSSRSSIATLLVVLTLCASGCSTVDFVPSRSLEFPLARPLAEEIDRRGIRPWFDDPPTTIDSSVTLYYALELTDDTGTDQWLIRVLPTADLKTGRARARRGNQERWTAEDRREFQLGLLAGLTAEYEEHSERWIDEVYEIESDYTFGFEEEAPLVPIYADTFGPVRRGAQETNETAHAWQRASRPIPVLPVFFEVDLPLAVDRAQNLTTLDPQSTDPLERHETLSSVALSKVKVAQGLIMILGNEALRSIANRVVERPSPLAMAGTAVRWLTSSRPSMARWLGELSGLRFETLDPASTPLNPAGVPIVRLRFEPQLSTTTLLKTEITAAPTEAAPKLSAGFVSIEGINPYDDEKRFTLRLLGWSRSAAPDERLLSSPAEVFSFSADGTTLVSELGEVWRLPTDSDARVPQVRPAAKNIGDWSSDGRYYVELQDDGTAVEVIDLNHPEAPGDRFSIPKSSALSHVDVSPDGRYVTFIRLSGQEMTAVVQEIGRDDPIRVIPDAIHLTLDPSDAAPYVEVLAGLPEEDSGVTRIPLPLSIEGAAVPSSAGVETAPAEPAWVHILDAGTGEVEIFTPAGSVTRRVALELDGAWVSPRADWLMVHGTDVDGLSTHRLVKLPPVETRPGE